MGDSLSTYERKQHLPPPPLFSFAVIPTKVDVHSDFRRIFGVVGGNAIQLAADDRPCRVLVARWALDGLRIYGVSEPVPLAKATEIGKHGGNRSVKQATSGRLKYGMNPEYLTARLKRDAPEIAAKLDTYPSVAAAARDAGIKKKEDRITLGQPSTVAARIAARGHDYAQAVVDARPGQVLDIE